MSETSRFTRESKKLSRVVRVGVAAGTLALSYALHSRELIESPESWSGLAEEFFTGVPHSAPAYYGALVAASANPRHPLAAAFVGGSAADGAMEIASALDSSDFRRPLASFDGPNQLETLKDYAFAMGGTALFMLKHHVQSRRK